ncbi:TPA: ead/Ea22-like family protein [Escherichia coli]|uniref:Ead/Ea22-like family protein n=2 Tax=Salmonella enterica I TaxID=59201 RepID=A0A740VB84_SALTM|nr:ead/Ea22-like family protein [Escherichia coli]EAO5728824.1 ead/Ea22-like family protein [Salmonella enterica]EBV0104975.1 ead/Ea22-like family protein [Salmonella enterica subsp. enterica serovar Derby]ECN5875933.1 ead/Ea22-like family protein [Salmonella enterica subsp. enterica serovar Typhimurium]EDB0580025.1 ead/Ea22-like family protein [Salmonella enterica subsp. enterica]EDI0570740.1 ead/Ea22-like family protein [Salmonella enterica subsp. enterica serovar Berkeley]EDX4725217.1 ead/
MSETNYQELREAAEQATQDEWVAYILPGHNGIYPARTSEGRHCGYFIDWPGTDGQRNASANARYIAAIPPKVALDLLGEIKRLEDKNIDAMCQIAELESNRAALAAEHGIQIAINELLALAPRLDKRAVDALSVAVEHLCKLIKKEAVSEQN